MNRYFEVTILTSLHQKKFAMYNDETWNITSVEQIVIYVNFNHNRKISGHFVGITPISKMVKTHLSTANVLSTFESYFQKLEIPFKNNPRFFIMDTINVNSGEKKGLKQLLKHLIPLATWIGCGNHKVTLCFKHLLSEYKSVFSVGAAFDALWKIFHFHPLALGFMEKVADIYGEMLVTPVYSSTTRWTTHDLVSKSLCEGHKQLLHAHENDVVNLK